MFTWFLIFETMMIVGMLVGIIVPWTIMWSYGIDRTKPIMVGLAVGVTLALVGLVGAVYIIINM